MQNPFFKNNGPFEISQLLKLGDIENTNNYSQKIITDIKDLHSANEDNLTFFHTKKYENLALKTKASFCVTTENLSLLLPKNCNPIIVDNVFKPNMWTLQA